MFQEIDIDAVYYAGNELNWLGIDRPWCIFSYRTHPNFGQ